MSVCYEKTILIIKYVNNTLKRMRPSENGLNIDVPLVRLPQYCPKSIWLEPKDIRVQSIMKIISLFQIDDYRLTSKKGEGIKGTNSTRFHRSFDIHHVDFENGTSIGWFRVDQLPFTEKRVTIIARCRWYQTGRGQIAGRASWNGQFSTAYSRLIGFVSSWKSPMGDGPIHTEN